MKQLLSIFLTSLLVVSLVDSCPLCEQIGTNTNTYTPYIYIHMKHIKFLRSTTAFNPKRQLCNLES